MRLATFEIENGLGPIRRIGAVADDRIIDLNAAYGAYLAAGDATARINEIASAIVPPDMCEFISGGRLTREEADKALDFVSQQPSGDEALRGPNREIIIRRLNLVKLLAPLPTPNSIRDTLSFEGHMKNFEKRTGKPTPALWYETPIYYKGNRRSVVGPGAVIEWPLYTDKLDYELEFGVVIGKEGRDISVADASSYIAGYTIFNDISARDVIPKEVSMNLGPAKGKDMDAGNVLGPWLVTPDELDVSDLHMEARINGEVWSEGNTSDMYHSFPEIIAHISQSETLYSGDFIGSGTVADGCGDELERWIRPGDVVELEVEGIGVLKNTIGARGAAANRNGRVN